VFVTGKSIRGKNAHVIGNVGGGSNCDYGTCLVDLPVTIT